jgi:hypothetical protein
MVEYESWVAYAPETLLKQKLMAVGQLETRVTYLSTYFYEKKHGSHDRLVPVSIFTAITIYQQL